MLAFGLLCNILVRLFAEKWFMGEGLLLAEQTRQQPAPTVGKERRFRMFRTRAIAEKQGDALRNGQKIIQAKEKGYRPCIAGILPAIQEESA